jgi:hypothetical protein
MNQRLFIFLAIAAIVSSCGTPATGTPTSAPPTSTATAQPTDIPLPTVTPACNVSEPAQADIDRALTYTGETFNTTEWQQNYDVVGDHVSVTWQNSPQGAIAYLEALIFPCSYEEPDLNNYYSDENWKAIFANYESYERIDECKRDDGLRLYEFKTLNQGFEYKIRYWVESDTDTRIISTMIVFPLDTELLLDEYSSILFPDYPTCP